MSLRTGPFKTIYADTTIPGTSAVAMTAFQAKGNSIMLEVTTTTGGCGAITFTAEESLDNGTTYGDMLDRDSVWSMAITTATTAGTYLVPLEGLPICRGNYVRLSYTAAAAAGSIQVKALNYEDPRGAGASVSVGDIIADLAETNTLITAGNVDLAALEVLSTAANVDLAAQEVLQTTIAGDTTSLDAKQPALGTAAMAASSPVSPSRS